MVRHSLCGDFVKSREIHYQLSEFINSLFADGSPAGIKAALSISDLCRNNLRLPLVTVNKDVYKLIEKLIKQIEK
jgi:4-hydroxy-tetrahydrodipicolinate synthase